MSTFGSSVYYFGLHYYNKYLKLGWQDGSQAKVIPVAKPADLSSIPGLPWWKERTNAHNLFLDHNMHMCHTCAH